jgi:hypothetical protein
VDLSWVWETYDSQHQWIDISACVSIGQTVIIPQVRPHPLVLSPCDSMIHPPLPQFTAKGKKKETTAEIRWSSPTQLLIRPSLVWLWESRRGILCPERTRPGVSPAVGCASRPESPTPYERVNNGTVNVETLPFYSDLPFPKFVKCLTPVAPPKTWVF